MSRLEHANSWGWVTLMLLMGALVVGGLVACDSQDATATPAPAAQSLPTNTAPPAPAPAQEKTVYVGPTWVDCQGEGPQKCMLVKENPGDAFGLFYNQIEGFDFEEGYEYELLVKTEPVENPPAGGSSIKWTLVEVVNQTVSLEGRLWQLESYANSDSELVDVLPDTETTIEFRDGQLGGNAGCNSYFGSYEVDGNNLTVGGVGMTEMYCGAPEGVMEQESAYLATLQSAATYQITDDQLQVANGDGETVLAYTIVEPTPLTGTYWQLTGYNNGKGGFTSVLAGTEITANFSDDGKLAGSAGCNNYTSSYSADGTTISIGPLGATMMMCSEPEDIMEQESQYLAALERAHTYEIMGDQLEVKDLDGARVVSYVAVPPQTLEGSTWDVISYNNGKQAVVSVIIGSEITADFDDGKLTGSAGCNNYTASYEVDSDKITVGPAATTRKMCSEPEGIMEQEAQYLTALETAATYQVQSDRMEMRTADGALAVSYSASEDASVSSELMTALRNMTYKIDTTASGEAPLTDGEYREKAAPDSATETAVLLTEHVAYGTLSNGEPAAAVILVSDPGGSGTFYYLAVVNNQNGEPVNVATTLLGDRVKIQSLVIEDGRFVVELVTHGPDEALCCPTQQAVQTYELQVDELVQTSSEVAGSADGSREEGADLTGIVWKWEQLTTPVDTITVDEPDRYTVEFQPDGQVSVQADCNAGSGTYTLRRSSISIEILAITMAACPPDSLSDEFVKNLNTAAITFREGENLFIDLEFDSGTMKFTQ